jgi:8-oxo-dGTP pyrophosphatase MutT (NUDIX family)
MSSNPHGPDPRFDPLRAVLSSPPHAPDPSPKDGNYQAAVAVVLRGCEDLELLLIKRARSPSDPWSGHMAFPGGKREPGDRSLLHTAIRETHEETGVALRPDRHHLGRLSLVDPATRRLPPLTITPFVFGVAGGSVARAASSEVDRVFWVPISQLLNPASRGTYRYDAGDMVRRFPSFNVQDQVVWGLTYRVLEEFLERMRRL